MHLAVHHGAFLHTTIGPPHNPMAMPLTVHKWAFMHIAIGKPQNPVAGSFDMRMVKMFAMLEFSCLFGRL